MSCLPWYPVPDTLAKTFKTDTKMKDKFNRKMYRDTLKSAINYYKNRDREEKVDELEEELRELNKTSKKRKKRNEE